jgi:hypothetical protein
MNVYFVGNYLICDKKFAESDSYDNKIEYSYAVSGCRLYYQQFSEA